MAQIKNKVLFASLIKEGVRALAQLGSVSVGQTELEMAGRLVVEPRTLKSWKVPSEVPDNLADEKLLGLGWLVLEKGARGLEWFCALLEVTSLPVVKPAEPAWFRSCLGEVRIFAPSLNSFSPLSHSQIEGLLTRFFGPDPEVVSGNLAGAFNPTHTKEIPNPTPAPPLEIPGQPLSVVSPLYIERIADRLARETVEKQRGFTLVIKSPRQMGKTSLLLRLLQKAHSYPRQIALLDFQRFEHATLRDGKSFYRQFCSLISHRLQLKNRIEEFWSEPLGNLQLTTDYFEDYILPALAQSGSSLLLAMDEVDYLFDTPFRSDFFGMLRSWHNSRQASPVWQNFDLILITSTQPYQFVETLTQSPFNVGLTVELADFGFEELATLNERHHSPLSPHQLEELFELTAGQPFLAQQTFYLLNKGLYTVKELFDQSSFERGPFGDHLRYFLQNLRNQPALIDGLRQVLTGCTRLNEPVFWRLQGAGLVKWDTAGGGVVIPRCPLYARFFKEYLL